MYGARRIDARQTHAPVGLLCLWTLYARGSRVSRRQTGRARLGEYGQIHCSFMRNLLYILAHEMGVNAIAEFMKPWGFGQLTGVDLEGEARGVLPSTEWKKRAYRRPAQQKWYEGETISLGVGQGYNAFTMLQLAHAVA